MCCLIFFGRIYLPRLGAISVEVTRLAMLNSFRIEVGSKSILMPPKYDLKSTTMTYIIRDVDDRILRTYSKKLENCLILRHFSSSTIIRQIHFCGTACLVFLFYKICQHIIHGWNLPSLSTLPLNY